MPRPKSYDRQDAVKKAAAAFWEHGYQALGVRELEQLTGLNQFAIRSEFGGKEALFLEALHFYGDAAINQEMAALKEGGISEIIAFLHKLVTPGAMISSDHGCLMVNTGIENARVKSAALDAAVQSYWQTLESHFRQALENEHSLQGGTAQFSPQYLAASLIPAVMGVHARNRAERDQTAGRGLVDLLSAMLSDLRTGP